MKKSIAQLKRDSRMLDQILDIIAGKVYEGDRPMFDAVLSYRQSGRQAETLVEIAALNEYRRSCRRDANPNNLNDRREIVGRVTLLLLADVHPETKKEVKTDDQQC